MKKSLVALNLHVFVPRFFYLGTNKWKYKAIIMLSSENLKPDGQFKLRSVWYFSDKEVSGYFLCYHVHIRSLVTILKELNA